MFERILIANRGEIACRVIATARRMGIATVAVYSDADRDALHVQRADHSVAIGPAPASQSYLQIDKIIAAAQATGAQAIHPGYGFLSENAAFARACESAGLVFIGPSADAIDAMGSKAQAKAIMADAGVPLIPGYHGDDQSDAVLRAEAETMGFPVLLKATAGGGGKGMRAVHSADEFDEALAAARRESQASFGDERMLVEKLIERPRHVEIQVFCDSQGEGVYLAERDCSIQRRHQKVIEEAPAPGLDYALRKAMGEAAVAAAKAIAYRGAGTVEFLLAKDQRFYFMEMNTRLQVEHPVTEMITDTDLVEWQLRVAAGEPLPRGQHELRVTGHAMEARIYAEDPSQGFLPATGLITYMRTPEEGPQLRVDTGVEQGSDISPYYDPMIAKLVVHGDTREAARRKLVRALGAFHVLGPANNITFLQRIAALEAFAQEDLDTGFIERFEAALLPPAAPAQLRDLAGAALLLQAQREATAAAPSDDRYSPWSVRQGWRVNLPQRQQFTVLNGDTEYALELERQGDAWLLHHDGDVLPLEGAVTGDKIDVCIAGRRWQGRGATGEQSALFWEDGTWAFSEKRLELAASGAAAGDAAFAAPMHGTVVALLADVGARVEAGDPVIVMEAMKMEQTLRAPTAGTVESFPFAPGDLVDRGASLVQFTPVDAS